MKMKKNIVFFIFAVSSLLTACGVYSFSGASIDYNTTKTVSISFFYNESGLGPASISQDFTNKLRDYFQQNTNLSLVEDDGDIQLEGVIADFNYKPLAPQSGGSYNPDTGSGFEDADAAGLEQLTISIKTTFINVNDDQFDFQDRTFSQFDSYSTTTSSREAAESGLTNKILDQIVIDIFNAAVANW